MEHHAEMGDYAVTRYRGFGAFLEWRPGAFAPRFMLTPAPRLDP